MVSSVPWLAVASLASGIISLGFMRYLWSYRGRLGGRFFVATIGCEALWSLSYGLALFVFDPALREAFEIPIWIGINFIGVFFLAFALEYTGRGNVLRSKVMGGVVSLQVLHTLVVVTNPLHQIAWSGYRIEPTYGLATVVYAHQPWLFVNAAGFILMIAVASFLLADTVFSYGPLYRTQAAAIAVSPIFPGLPFLLWLAEVGATPPLNLTPLLFPIHLAFDMYAFFSRDMFEMVPAARRIADRAAIDNLGSAVVIVDSGRRIIECNEEAALLLDAPRDEALGSRLETHLDDVDPGGDNAPITRRRDGRKRTYAVTTSPLTDASGTAVGDTIVFQDITEQRRREQRLAVLNRVLRHNLRNDLNVVTGYLEMARERVEDEEVRRMLGTAAENTAGVVELGEKARHVERALDADGEEPTAVALRPLLEGIADDLVEPGSNGEIRVDVPGDATVRATPALLEIVFENLLENALVHDPSDSSSATVRPAEGDADEGFLAIEVADEGSGIPEHELAVLDETGETALEHGSGLGLWIVTWGVDSLAGTVDFAVSERGTSVTLELPTPDEAAASEGQERPDA
ncbi:histidine kinase N-terminal 7TM domain-containing protein [Halobellus litoreus]|uniref:Histidine kinase N-terminal 7TM domain-containing protein n=1 Tax=Halobellus litoreus TaxID=755310 RepID=A0ABD6DTP0_9EURY